MRPTLAIRGLLLLDLAERHIRQQRARLLRLLEESQTEIVDVMEEDLEWIVKYKEKGYTHEAIYMRPMLTAELEARMQLGPVHEQH